MKTKTIFRKFKNNGDIIALFPETPTDLDGKYCDSYMHIGQPYGGEVWDHNGLGYRVYKNSYRKLVMPIEYHKN